MATNYDKWNKFASELSDNEDEEETSTKPRVTTFDSDKGRSFVIGPSGAQLMPQPPASSSARKAPVVVESSSVSVIKFELSSRNGGRTDRCTWSQDRNEVIVRKEFPMSVKASDIHVFFDRIESLLTVTVQKEPFLQGTMRYKFELNDDEMCPILWEVVTMTEQSGAVHRVFEMTLKKISPIPGAVIWWKNVFVGNYKHHTTYHTHFTSLTPSKPDPNTTLSQPNHYSKVLTLTPYLIHLNPILYSTVDDPEIDVTAIPDRAASSSTTGKHPSCDHTPLL